MIIDIVLNYIDKKGYTKSYVEKKAGLSNAYLANIKKSNSDIQPAMVRKLLVAFPDLENDLTKEVIPVGKQAIKRAASEAFDEWRGLPMYNVPITASFVAQYRDESYIEPLYYFRDPRFKDCDFGAIVTGDSMHSEIRHGDFVVCKEVTDKSFIVFGEIYYIVSKNGLETCKYVNAGDDDECLLLVPRNEKISPSPIKKNMILKMYKVKGIVRGY